MPAMTTTLTLVGSMPLGWDPIPGQQVTVPGLDPSFTHTITAVQVNEDRTETVLTIETTRPTGLDMVQHLSLRPDASQKAAVRVVLATTGEALAEGRYDAFLQIGQQIWVGGAPYSVLSAEWPNRNPETGTTPRDQLDWQVATVTPVAEETVQPVGGDA